MAANSKLYGEAERTMKRMASAGANFENGIGKPLADRGAAASAGWMTAMTLEPAAHVRRIGLLEVVFSYGVTVFWFREQPTARELIATALIVGGIVLLLTSLG